MRLPLLAVPLLSLAISACGPLPHPFEREGRNPLISNLSLVPLSLTAIAAPAGFEDSLTKALNDEDLAATSERKADFYRLTGAIASSGGERGLVWRVTGPDGRTIGQTRIDLPADWPDPSSRQPVARDSARAIALLLRGADSGVADLDARPHVALEGIKGPDGFDLIALKNALIDQLGIQGAAVGPMPQDYVLSGVVKVTPLGTGKDLVQLDWTIRDRKGRDVATMTQANPVDDEILHRPMTDLARDIAGAGADGVVRAVHQVEMSRAAE